MRILFVNRMASMVRGGGETFDLEISRYLERLGCETSILSGIPMLGKAAVPVDRRRSWTIRSPYTGKLKWDRIPGVWRMRTADFYLFETKAARWIMHRKDQFDIIQACELPYLVHALKKKGCTLPVSMRLTAPDYHDPVQAVQLADQVIASGDTMQKMRAGARPDCVDVPNGVDVSLFKPQSTMFRQQAHIPEDALVILFVARFQTVKNHPMLIKAFSRLVSQDPEARLVLAGSGPFEDQVRACVREHNLEKNVCFLGEVAFPDLPKIYAAADIKVISSDYESFCFAVLEGMASELPFVVTDTNWIPGIIGDGEGGFVVPIGDADAMADRLLKLAGDKAFREKMGKRNRQAVLDRFQWESSAQTLLEAYTALKEKHAPAG